MSELNIAVLGAGVIGLTTAIELQKEFRNAKITILADKFTTETTSDGAAGLFRPGTSFCGPDVEITSKWIKDAYEYWENIWRTSEGAKAGVTQLAGYIFSSTNKAIVKNHLIESIVPLYREATKEELQLCPGNWKYGSYFKTMLTECRIYQPYAMEKFINQGGIIMKKKIENFDEIPKNYDIVINCTGLGAKFLCNDYKLVPIRGQVMKVDAPFVKTFFYGDYDTYIIPGFSSVTLGGTRQYDSWDINVSKYDSAAIKERCENLLPSLRNAPLIREWVGLRPHRDPVRVEKEIINIDDRKLKIVHNYGHGGYGVTTAPGTSIYAVKLTKEIWIGNSKM